jgi:hypothetical protein
MYAQMDTVDGAQVRKSTTSGYFVLTGNLYVQNGDLQAFKVNADSRVMLQGFNLSNVPKEGDKLDNVNYKNWICVDRQIVPRSALVYQIICIFRWLGSLQIRDHTTLEQITTVLNAGTKKPIYNTWTDPNPAPGTTARTIKKLCHFPRYRGLRNITYTKTVNFTARDAVLQAKNTCNDSPWFGLDAGYWLVSDILGDTFDAGITYTYSVTFTTRDEISWSEYNILEDDRGQQIYVDPAKFNTLVNKTYTAFLEDNTTCPGVVRHDPYGTTNYPLVFGVGPGESTTVDLSGIM